MRFAVMRLRPYALRSCAPRGLAFTVLRLRPAACVQPFVLRAVWRAPRLLLGTAMSSRLRIAPTATVEALVAILDIF